VNLTKPIRSNISMKRLLFTFFLAICVWSAAFSQTSTWYFGTNAGLSWPGPVAAPGSAMVTNEGCTGVTDVNGDVIFYADGRSLWDGSHSLISTALLGGASSTQAAIAVPVPGDACRKFLVFTTLGVENTGFANGLGITLVNVAGAGFPYSVSVVGSAYIQGNVAEKLTCTPDNAGGYWVAAHSWANSGTSRTFYVYHITPAVAAGWTVPGVTAYLAANVTAQVVGTVDHSGTAGPPYYNAQGQMKFSLTGNKLACAIAGDKVAEVFTFNNGTGTLAYDRTITVAGSGNLYGLEFSPNSNVLYLAEDFGGTSFNRRLLQYDISTAFTPAPYVVANSSGQYYPWNALQIGPDQRVYVAGPNTANTSLSVIANPNTVGAGCGYSALSVGIAGTTTHGLPTVIAGQVSCDPGGGDPDPQGCDCHGVMVETAGINTQNNGSSTATFSLSSGGKKIKEIRATITAWNTTLSSPACKDYCNLKPADMGNFVGTIGNINQFNGAYGPYATNTSGSWAHEITWTTPTPRTINTENVSLTLQFPPVLALSCCSQNIQYCIRFDFIDENCQVCSVVVCTSGRDSDGGGDDDGTTDPKKDGAIPVEPNEKSDAKLKDVQAPVNFDVFPNPNDGTFTIRAGKDCEAYYEIFDQTGKLIQKGYMKGREKTINLEDSLKGTFMIRITDGSNVSTNKIVLN
jgi:hypothetical protein